MTRRDITAMLNFSRFLYVPALDGIIGASRNATTQIRQAGQAMRALKRALKWRGRRSTAFRRGRRPRMF